MSMLEHWYNVILPLLEHICPCTIVEVGVNEGGHLKKLREWLKTVDCGRCVEPQLIGIDPDPKISDKDIETMSDILKLLKQTSLRILPTLTDYDLIILDGDHNYYTLYNELQIIDKTSHKKKCSPTIICHDTMLNGHEDNYYNPSLIPEEYINNENCYGLVPAINDFLIDSLLPWKIEWITDDPGLAVLYCGDYPTEKREKIMVAEAV